MSVRLCARQKFSLGMTFRWALVKKIRLRVEFTFKHGFGHASEAAFLYVRQS